MMPAVIPAERSPARYFFLYFGSQTSMGNRRVIIRAKVLQLFKYTLFEYGPYTPSEDLKPAIY